MLATVVARTFRDVIQTEIERFVFVFGIFTTQFPDMSPVQEEKDNDRAYERNAGWSSKGQLRFPHIDCLDSRMIEAWKRHVHHS